MAPSGTARVTEASPASGRGGWSDPVSEIDPLDELERILAPRPKRFRLQFFAVAGDSGPSVVAESELQAADASAAIRAAADAEWPAHAIGLRILDREGQEIYERLKADRR